MYLEATLLSIVISIPTVNSADLPSWHVRSFDWLLWKDVLPDIELSISPIGLTGWQHERYLYAPAVYSSVAHPEISAVCWPDVKTCSDSNYVLCDVEVYDTPEIIKAHQIVIWKPTRAQQCVAQENLSRLENGDETLRGSISYRRGIRP
jgi:hypothetical protein